jgi:DNA polymerase I-like protein with 3'-5' exonuclease and polymerase domains
VKEAQAAIEREGANFQVQSVNVEWTKTAMYEMRKRFKQRKYDVKMHNAPYDETVIDAHISCAQDVHELQGKIMIESANRFMKTVPVEVEGHLKPYWTK